MKEPENDPLIPADMRLVSILDCSPGRLDAGDGEWAATLLFATHNGVMESLAFSWKDMLFLANEIRDAIAHIEEERATFASSGSHDRPESRTSQEPAPEPASPQKQFVSDLQPTGLTLRKWVGGKLQIYDILGGYALPDAGHYILLCRHGARPKHDFCMLAVKDRDKLITSVADDHPTALERQPYMWRWFANWGTRKNVQYGRPLVNVRKLGLAKLKALVAPKKNKGI